MIRPSRIFFSVLQEVKLATIIELAVGKGYLLCIIVKILEQISRTQHSGGHWMVKPTIGLGCALRNRRLEGVNLRVSRDI